MWVCLLVSFVISFEADFRAAGWAFSQGTPFSVVVEELKQNEVPEECFPSICHFPSYWTLASFCEDLLADYIYE